MTSSSVKGLGAEIVQLRKSAISLETLKNKSFDQLLAAVGDAQVVLIGESTHGTEEFYRQRAELSKLLIDKKGFNFVAVEADWPDAYRVNRFCKGHSKDKEAADAFQDFKRFPRWMWRNHATVDFAKWLREFNKDKAEADKAGFYGLDLYAMQNSAQKVIEYLETTNKELAKLARQRYRTVLKYEEGSNYGWACLTGIVEPQRDQVVKMLVDLMAKAPDLIQSHLGYADESDEYFFTEQNAKLVKDAEEYYRNMISGGAVTWNIRDQHMCQTLDSLLKHYDFRRATRGNTKDILHRVDGKLKIRADTPSVMEQLAKLAIDSAKGASERAETPGLVESKDAKSGTPAAEQQPQPITRSKAIIWAHNSHLGDARATDFRLRNEINLGQLCRQRFGLENTFSIGQNTYDGTVSAARAWDGQRQTMTINPGLSGSYEELDHMVFGRDLPESKRENQGFCWILRSNNKEIVPDAKTIEILKPARWERFIGVLYVKATEKQSHYSRCVLPEQFDAWLHVDRTSYLRPIDEDEQVSQSSAMEDEDED